MGVSKNKDTPKSSILIGVSIVNRPFWGTPIFGNTHIGIFISLEYIEYTQILLIRSCSSVLLLGYRQTPYSQRLWSGFMDHGVKITENIE